MSRKLNYLVLAAAFTFAACDDEVSEPAGDLAADEAADVAVALSDIGYETMSVELAADAFAAAGPMGAPPIDVTHEFERTHPCPRGGQIVVAGTSVGVIDRDSQHVVIDTDAIKTHESCVVATRRGEVELNGAPNIAMSAHFERREGLPSGPQSLSLEGGFSWQAVAGERAGTCEIDVDVVWQRSDGSGSRTVNGFVCGREIHSETTWSVQG